MAWESRDSIVHELASAIVDAISAEIDKAGAMTMGEIELALQSAYDVMRDWAEERSDRPRTIN